ncbi:nuclear transport factor 2 family protein [Nocardia sp. NPDC088792]|uniref:nuclear transport factor 2 family protein n=1 Tax=Nocardia sp. NPDC088792 TaxID=3364332 RepID=UPI003822E585
MTIIANLDDRTSLLEQDQRFFDALVAADTNSLNELLAEDFILVAVNDGATVTKADLLAVMASGTLRFPAIESHPAEAIVRRIAEVAIVVGRTSMNFTNPDGTTFTTASRYTHVFSYDDVAGWRLVSAQGTQITPASQPSTQ